MSKSIIIGSNLRRGVTPGGFSRPFSDHNQSWPSRSVRANAVNGSVTAKAVREAFEKRGLHNEASGFEQAAQNL